jgi:hypothetical protein
VCICKAAAFEALLVCVFARLQHSRHCWCVYLQGCSIRGTVDVCICKAAALEALLLCVFARLQHSMHCLQSMQNMFSFMTY